MNITSSNTYFEGLMKWAAEKASQFVMTGKSGPINKGDGDKWYGPSRRFSDKSRKIRKPTKPWAQEKPYIPSYWAGYYDRTAFYIRDFVHQARGAHFLGYSEENYSMLKSFVELASAESGRYAPWALNFDGSIYYMDTPNYRRFVRELTGQYELVEIICRLYLLTGDKRYLDKAFMEFSEHILNDFTENQDSNHNTIPEGTGNLWRGSSSYNESGKALFEAGDSIAALYKALSSYSELLKSLGENEKADGYKRRAYKLKRYFNDDWSLSPNGGYVFGIDKSGKKYYEWTKSVSGIIGAETCFIMPAKQLTEAGERNDRLLKYIDERAKDKKTRMPNIESYTYLPEVFFPYHKGDEAWYWMKYIGESLNEQHVKASQGKNGDYPEISFTMISHAVEGLMGFSADVPNGVISTLPCLPSEIPDISVKELTLGDIVLDIALTGEKTAELTNRSDRPLVWKCSFAQNAEKLYVDGKEADCRYETVNGVLCAFTEAAVEPDTTVRIEIN